jgi:hypothetical protein
MPSAKKPAKTRARKKMKDLKSRKDPKGGAFDSYMVFKEPTTPTSDKSG